MEQPLHLVREGHCPNMQRLIEGGAYREMWGVLPTLDLPGWTTPVTGAWPSTHKVMDFNIYQPGQAHRRQRLGHQHPPLPGRVPLEHHRAGRKDAPPGEVRDVLAPHAERKDRGVQVEGTGPGISNHAQIAGYHCFTVGRQEQEQASGDSAAVDPRRCASAGATTP